METKLESEVYEFDSFRIDGGKRLLWNRGEPLPLTPKVFDTLFYLARNAGKTIGKDELMAAIWPDTVVEENNLNKNISALRQSLGEKPAEHRFIATVPGRGYKFVAPVVEVSGSGFPEAEADLLERTLTVLLGDDASEPGRRFTLRTLPARYWAIATITIVVIATIVYLLKPPTPRNSIAILPFHPLAEGTGNAAMGLGMADSLIMQLSKSDNLMVRPLSATRPYAAKDVDPVEIGRALHVEVVLDGTVQMADGRIRISTRLIRTADGKQLWAGNFDEPMRDVFAMQDSITDRVAGVLNAKLGKQSRKRYTDNVESYQLYVLGKYTASKLTPQDHYKAIEYLRKAIEKDPDYALAYTGITSSYITFTLASDAPPAGTLPEAKTAAIKATELDDELPEAHVALGRVAMWYDWNWGEAERQLLRAYDLDPNDPECLVYLAHFYSNMGVHQKAIELGEKARKLDPLSIQRAALPGQFLFYAGRYDDAIKDLKETIELNPNHWLPRMFIARAYIEKGMYREAIAECERSRELGSTSLELITLAGWSYAKLGEEEQARAALGELEKVAQQRYVPPYLVALLYNALGETDLALSMLEKGLAVRDARMTFLKVDPKWNNLHNDPRFIAVMKQMKFE
jgi:serine/threonine-protein kinase